MNNTYTTDTPILTPNSNIFTSLRNISVPFQNSYNFKLDEDVKMVYAYNPGNATLSFHHRNYGFFNIKLDSSTGSCTM